MENQKQVQPEFVINQLFIKVNQLQSDCIVKNAYIAQLEEQIKSLSSKKEEPEEK